MDFYLYDVASDVSARPWHPDTEPLLFVTHPAPNALGGGRRLLSSDVCTDGNALGDVNGDCTFNAADYVTLLKWLAGKDGFTDISELGTIDNWRRRQLDPTLDWLAGDDFDPVRCHQNSDQGAPCPEVGLCRLIP